MSQIERQISEFVALGKEVKGKDNKAIRPDVRVDIVSAKVSEINERGNAVNVIFKVPGQQFAHNGYIGSNELVLQLLRKAKELDKPVIARLERKRKKNIDPEAHIADLTIDMNTARDNSVRITCGVYDENKKQWVLTEEAESSPSEDPEEVQTGIRSAMYSPDEFFNTSPKATTDSTMRPSSQTREMNSKSDSLLTLYFFVKEESEKLELKLSDDELKEYAKILALSLDLIQKHIFKIKNPIYSDYSYTRTRYLLFQYTEHVSPLTADVLKDKNNLKSWAKTFMRDGSNIWNWAIEDSKK